MNNVLEWLEDSADRLPDKVAFSSDRDELTFAGLRDVAHAVGSFLAQRQDACMPVAVLAHKDAATVAALMGVVYARGYYCNLDERQPADRMATIVRSLAPRFVLVDDEHRDQAAEAFGELKVEVVPIADAAAAPVDEGALAARRATALDVDPLYVNFTSGSTGTPKGVVVGHRSVIDFIGNFTALFGIASDDRIANQAPFDFDVSVKDIYSGLAMGATVHLIPRDYFSVPTRLMDFLAEREVTVCTWAVSAMCFVSIMGGFDYRAVPSIRLVIFSGEVMPPKQLAKWREHLPEATYVNVYGPTEVTCNCTYHVVDRDYGKGEAIPIGKPFPNEKVFLLDEAGQLVESVGDQGEICVAGAGLALGYCNDPERTAAAFVQNPLNSAYLELMYRTGDLARYDENGDLVYIGRKDHQIKHMGQRIELGDIEATAAALDGVDRACCVYSERKKRIMMYYSGAVGKDELIVRLEGKLPGYMVPNRVSQLDELPMTKNGKIDRAKLAELT